MQYRCSTLLAPPVDEQGFRELCGALPLRKHNDAHKERIRACRAQDDWSRLVEPVKNYKGGLAKEFGFMQVCVPECLPERLEIVSYANEMAFLYDGTCWKVAIC